jgi:5-methylcytosine-specific restriction endonuclease McrA
MSRTIKSLRKRAFQLQSGCCYYCGARMWQTHPKEIAVPFGLTNGEVLPFKCTAEHLVARCDGGKDKRANIVAACQICNIRRHRRSHPAPPLLYRSLVRRRIAKGKWHSGRSRCLLPDSSPENVSHGVA